MKPKRDRRCQVCGVFLFNRQPYAKYCKKCYLEKKKAYFRAYYYRKKKEREEKENGRKNTTKAM